MAKELKFAPREIFEQLLEYMVIPTFDLVIEYGEQGIVLVRRTIAPYQHQWALPGLRMHKGESIDDTLRRIARQEVGLEIDPRQKVLLGQFVGKFKTEHQRQDLSTGYWIKVASDRPLTPNPAHFSDVRITYAPPRNMGAMYRFYLQRCQDLRAG